MPSFLVAKNTAACVFTNVTACTGPAATCGSYSDYIDCEVKRVEKTCGKASACFVHKYLTLENCYFDSTCGVCPSFATTFVSNSVDGICSDDVNHGNNVFLSKFKKIEKLQASWVVFFETAKNFHQRQRRCMQILGNASVLLAFRQRSSFTPTRVGKEVRCVSASPKPIDFWKENQGNMTKSGVVLF